MTGRELWLRLGAIWGLAAALALLARPDRPRADALAGHGATLVLAGLAALAVRHRDTVAPAVALVLAGSAAAEEVLWRWFALGMLLRPVGPWPALLASAVGFGLAHPGRSRLHTATGLSFGGVYVLSGSLAAAIGAHGAYNLVVAASAGSRTAPA